MKIIIKGDLKKLKKVKTFDCNFCGCLFEANKDEYKSGSQYNQTYYYCICPFCHNTVYLK